MQSSKWFSKQLTPHCIVRLKIPDDMFQHHRFLITLCTLLLAQVPMVTISPPGFPTLTCALTVDGGPHSRLKVLTAFCAFFYQINFYYYFLFHSLAGLLFSHTSMSCLQDPTLFECNFRLYFLWQKVAVRVWLYKTPCIVDSPVYISLSFTLLSISNKHRFWNLIIPTLWYNWGHRIGSGIEKSTVIIRKRRKGRKRWEKAEKSRLDFAISLLAKEVMHYILSQEV